ncbi:MAG: hypothetical protein HYX83_04070 [Chloroflexi bacterium]|nr:hypothetical protein [Chloroflexota bacterium]
MKNQYFGDNKDLFNYDLVQEIMSAGLVEHLTFIPMLTPDDNKGHGNKYNRSRARAGFKNTDLMSFLDQCIENDNRDIRQLERYFAKHGVKMTSYAKDAFFTHKNRKQYFAQIGDALLRKSLAFVDPDIGLEVKNPGKEHLLFSDIKDLYERMDAGSILMLAQHFPRVNQVEYMNSRSTELKEKVSGDFPVCIDDGEIIFFFLTKDHDLSHKLVGLAGEYAERYARQQRTL